MTKDRHIASVELVDPRKGASRTAVCSCGWRGPQRSSLELSVDDALLHEKSEFAIVRGAGEEDVSFSGRGNFAFGDPRAHAVAELRSAFADFSRNGRWGTCGSCPCDGYGRKLPELCSNTNRHDHQLDIDALSRSFKKEVRQFAQGGTPRSEIDG